jgi:Predicted ATP-utilizing enzyme (ATP-grasp superfamily)
MLSEIVGEKLLGPPYNLVKIFSDKSSTINALEECGVKTPRTMLAEDLTSISEKLSELNPPYVVKPTLLAGSECVYFAENESDALRLAREAIKCDPSGRALIQEYINGVHGSISVIYGENNYLFYSLNLQLILLSGSRLRYIGGILPTRITSLKEKAEIVLNKLIKCYPLLRGYIGLDIVWTGKDVYVVEVNPRPTTSIIGIYELFPQFGEYLVKSIVKHEDVFEDSFLGDMVNDYAYYIILSKPQRVLENERIMSINGSMKHILIGRSSSKNNILDRVSELLPINELIYDLNQSL